MELIDERITLRPPAEIDATAVASAVRASHAELAPWMPWAGSDYGVDAALVWIRGETGDLHRFVIVDHDDGEIIGSCGLNRVDELNRTANLGYWVRSDRAGRGVATAATRLLMAFGTSVVELHRLEIVMSTRNEASRRVAEKAGAVYEGVRRSALLLEGERHDAHVFSVVATDPTVAPT